MRLVVLACLAVTGCGFSAEQLAEQKTHREFYARLNAVYDRTEEGQANANCRTKVQFSLASLPRTSFLDLERDARANQLHTECLLFWRRTGRMP